MTELDNLIEVLLLIKIIIRWNLLKLTSKGESHLMLAITEAWKGKGMCYVSSVLVSCWKVMLSMLCQRYGNTACHFGKYLCNDFYSVEKYWK